MIRYRYINILLILLILGILVQTFSCASVASPSGGPEDKLPPRVSGTTLAPGAINQNLDLDLTLQFDEWIIQKPPNGAVAISPPISGKLRVEADGEKLRIYSTAPLDSSTTYTLTVTNAIKDLQGNPLEKPFQILFSTGSFLDSLKVNFSVLLQDSLTTRKKFPVVAFYPIGASRSHKGYLEKFRDSTLSAELDTFPNITKEIPQYIAQTDSLGNGILQGMQAGLYLAAAFLDENNNQKLDATSEIAGIAAFPFKLTEATSDSLQSLRFSLGDLDTSSFSLDAVSQRGNREMEFSFSRNIILDSLFKQKSNCFFLNGKDTIFSSDSYVEINSKNPVLLFENLKNDTLYTARCLYAKDSLERQLDSARGSAKFRFKKIPEKDITSTVLSKIEPTTSASDVLPGLPIKLYYNRPILADTLKFRLYVNEDSVKTEVKQLDAISLEISADSIWGTDSKIKFVQVEKDSVVDTLFNEKILTQFSTISKLKLASLKGEIPGGDAQTIVNFQEIISIGVKVKPPAKQPTSLGRQWQTKCDSSGHFEIKDLPEGIYKLLYFKDLNGDGRLTSGSIYPLAAGEPWASPEEDLILPHGDDNFLKELLKDLPEFFYLNP